MQYMVLAYHFLNGVGLRLSRGQLPFGKLTELRGVVLSPFEQMLPSVRSDQRNDTSGFYKAQQHRYPVILSRSSAPFNIFNSNNCRCDKIVARTSHDGDVPCVWYCINL